MPTANRSHYARGHIFPVDSITLDVKEPYYCSQTNNLRIGRAVFPERYLEVEAFSSCLVAGAPTCLISGYGLARAFSVAASSEIRTHQRPNYQISCE